MRATGLFILFSLFSSWAFAQEEAGDRKPGRSDYYTIAPLAAIPISEYASDDRLSRDAGFAQQGFGIELSYAEFLTNSPAFIHLNLGFFANKTVGYSDAVAYANSISGNDYSVDRDPFFLNLPITAGLGLGTQTRMHDVYLKVAGGLNITKLTEATINVEREAKPYSSIGFSPCFGSEIGYIYKGVFNVAASYFNSPNAVFNIKEGSRDFSLNSNYTIEVIHIKLGIILGY